MEVRKWQDCDNPAEIMELLKFDECADKFSALLYFGKEKKDLLMVRDLLNSGYYTPEEIASSDSNLYKRWRNKDIINLLIEFADQAWQKLVDAQEILEFRVAPVGKSEEMTHMQKKLEYFSMNNPSVYEALVTLIKDKKLNIGLKTMLFRLLDDVEVNKENIINFIILYPSLEIWIQDSKYRDLYAEYDRKRVEIANSSDWRDMTNCELIMYKATEENKWEILEYFAYNDEKLFERIAKRYTSMNHMGVVRYSRDEVLKRYGNMDLSTMPVCLQQYVNYVREGIVFQQEQKEAKKMESSKRKQDRILSWREEDGTLVHLFNVGLIIPKSKDDYFSVLKKYLEEDLGVLGFVSKYKIDDVKGFEKMLEKFSLENEEYAKLIKEKNDRLQKSFIEESKAIITNICFKGVSLETLIRKYSGWDISKAIEFTKRFFEENYCDILGIKIIEYFYDRINFCYQDRDLEDIRKMLTIDEIRFIVGKKTFESMMMGKTVEIENIFYRKLEFLKRTCPEILEQKVNGASNDRIRVGLIKYNTKFEKSEYFKTQNFIITESNNQVEVTPQMVDMAYHYAKSNRLYISWNTMIKIIGAIAMGKIQNLEQMIKTRKSMTDEARSLIEQITDLDEYFKEINRCRK